MKPDVPLVLEDHAKRLLERIVPQLTGFDANGVTMMSFMLQMVAEEWDRAAAGRIEENAAIRQLFRDAAPVVSDSDLSGRLKALASDTDRDFHLSALDAANDALREALTELHAHIETLRTPAARNIEESIWADLRRSVDRRRVGLANF